MTKINIFKDGNVYTFKLKGHSGYAERGYDIVCSSISTLHYIIHNTFLRLGLCFKVEDNEIEDEEFIIKFKVFVIDNSQQQLINTAIEYFEELSSQYPLHVEFNYVE